MQDRDGCIDQTGKVPGGQRMRAWQRPSSQVTSRTRCSGFPMRIAAGRRPWRLAPLSLSVLRRGAARMFLVRGAALLTCPSSDGGVQGFGAVSNGPLSVDLTHRARTGGTTEKPGLPARQTTPFGRSDQDLRTRPSLQQTHDAAQVVNKGRCGIAMVRPGQPVYKATRLAYLGSGCL